MVNLTHLIADNGFLHVGQHTKVQGHFFLLKPDIMAHKIEDGILPLIMQCPGFGPQL